MPFVDEIPHNRDRQDQKMALRQQVQELPWLPTVQAAEVKARQERPARLSSDLWTYAAALPFIAARAISSPPAHEDALIIGRDPRGRQI